MCYSFESYDYHYLVLTVGSCGKTILDIDIGRNERLEQAHDVYKRMSDEYRNVDDRHMGNYTIGVDKGTEEKVDVKALWKKILNR